MRIFHKRLRHDKDTERKHRWITFVDGLRVDSISVKNECRFLCSRRDRSLNLQ